MCEALLPIYKRAPRLEMCVWLLTFICANLKMDGRLLIVQSHLLLFIIWEFHLNSYALLSCSSSKGWLSTLGLLNFCPFNWPTRTSLSYFIGGGEWQIFKYFRLKAQWPNNKYCWLKDRSILTCGGQSVCANSGLFSLMTRGESTLGLL